MNNPTLENLHLRSRQILSGTRGEIVTGLVVQGGGMRGIYSMAALATLEECGFGGCFDHVFGSSAGAINGAYLLANQARLACTVYLDEISKHFLNFCRPGKIVDVDFLIDDVLARRKPLDVGAVMKSRSILHILLTDFLTGKVDVVTNQDPTLNLIEALRATSALPFLYNKSVTVNSRQYIDGGIRGAIPLDYAIKSGCTDIVVVLTRELSFRRNRPSYLKRLIGQIWLRKFPKVTRDLVLSEDTEFNRTMKIIAKPEEFGFKGRLIVIYPTDLQRMVKRTTTNRDKLLTCASMARNDTRAALGLPALHDEPWRATP
ncbi:MAG: patatin-like phospholipase family protein [Limisphaerales bacterium]